MERDNRIPRDIVVSTEGQEVEFIPPQDFQDLDGTTYHMGGRLRPTDMTRHFSYFYFIPEPANPDLSRSQRIFREEYIRDVLALQEKAKGVE